MNSYFQATTLEPAFTITQTDCENFSVESQNNSSGDNISYSWDMGDGATYDTADITHDYAGIGTYIVTLTMTDTICGIQEQEDTEVVITEEVVATISNGDVEGCAPLDITFTSTSPGIATWDFGDGSPSVTGNEVDHLYPSEGIYTVTLSVEGTGACSGVDETTSLVEVVEPPILQAARGHPLW